LLNFQERLNKVLDKSGINIDRGDIEILQAKLELLEKTSRYSLLLSELFNCNDISNFKSLLMEATFAHAFESTNIPLIYEVTQCNDHHSTVDFLRKTQDGRKIYFELRLIQQQEHVRKDINNQLSLTNMYSVSFNGTDEQKDIERLQSNILAKTQDKNGRPIKFFSAELGIFNIVVVDLSEIILGTVDKIDCMLAAYGDPSVEEYARRGIFGLFQVPQSNYPDLILSIADRFSHFRETIHGILFVVKSPNSTPLVFTLMYYLIFNSHIINKSDTFILNEDVRTAMQPWED
jgi:hypothetical protein